MASFSSSLDLNNAGCASGPHKPSGTREERASWQNYRVSGAMQPRSEHVTDRLIHQTSPEDHAEEIKRQVAMIATILPPSKTDSN